MNRQRARRKVTAEFEDESVAFMHSSGKPIAQVCRRDGISLHDADKSEPAKGGASRMAQLIDASDTQRRICPTVLGSVDRRISRDLAAAQTHASPATRSIGCSTGQYSGPRGLAILSDPMIEREEYLDAGFTQAQAALLMARDRRTEDRFEMLHASLSRGFADVLSTMQALTNQTVNGFTAMGARMDRIEERLGRVEEALHGPGRN